MEWHTLVPMESRLLLSQEGFQFDDRSGITKSFGSAQLASTFLGAFSGNLESLEPLFEISATGTLESWCLQMTPKNNLVADQIAEVQICGGNTTESVTIAEANGDSTELAFVANSIELQQ